MADSTVTVQLDSWVMRATHLCGLQPIVNRLNEPHSVAVGLRWHHERSEKKKTRLGQTDRHTRAFCTTQKVPSRETDKEINNRGRRKQARWNKLITHHQKNNVCWTERLRQGCSCEKKQVHHFTAAMGGLRISSLMLLRGLTERFDTTTESGKW